MNLLEDFGDLLENHLQKGNIYTVDLDTHSISCNLVNEKFCVFMDDEKIPFIKDEDFKKFCEKLEFTLNLMRCYEHKLKILTN